MSFDFKIGNIKNLDNIVPLGLETHNEIIEVARSLDLPLTQSWSDYYGKIISISTSELDKFYQEIEQLKVHMVTNNFAQSFFTQLIKLVKKAKKTNQSIIVHPD